MEQRLTFQTVGHTVVRCPKPVEAEGGAGGYDNADNANGQSYGNDYGNTYGDNNGGGDTYGGDNFGAPADEPAAAW